MQAQRRCRLPSDGGRGIVVIDRMTFSAQIRSEAHRSVKRIKVEVAPGVKTEFVDRDRALTQVKEWAEGAPGFPW
jgi:hypothetical protein